MNIQLYRLFLLGVLCTFSYANPPDWVDEPNAYEFTATVVGGIVLDIDGVQMGNDGDMFAAFDDDGNVRGIGLMLTPPFGPFEGTPVFEVQLRSNNNGEILFFKYYDASTHIIFDISESYVFEINETIGDVSDPETYNIYGYGNIDVMYFSNEDIGGFQFTVEGGTIDDATGGVAGEVGFTVSSGNNTVIGFSLSNSIIPAGEGILIVLDLEGSASQPCLKDLVISDDSGNAMDATVVDCTTIGIGPPELFSFNQSTLQAFYYFNLVLINNNEVESDDWVGAFKDDICVGAWQWDT
ncbi:MAG: hypothetical protein H8E85_06740, partial [Candidatus Marinimicrobia bacterium]|nr:hypothetical protein [Candidatus Neomarinimicrobiota bacterium]